MLKKNLLFSLRYSIFNNIYLFQYIIIELMIIFISMTQNWRFDMSNYFWYTKIIRLGYQNLEKEYKEAFSVFDTDNDELLSIKETSKVGYDIII